MIAKDPEKIYEYTTKGNLVAVVSNGTAVLGLGNIGPLAAKPVMEGKGVLFKRFADIDVFDIEVDAEDPDVFIETVARILFFSSERTLGICDSVTLVTAFMALVSGRRTSSSWLRTCTPTWMGRSR